MNESTSFSTLWDVLRNSKRVALSLHPSPDGDSLGSCAAMKYVLEREFGTRVTLISPDPVPENLRVLPFTSEVTFGTDISDLSPSDYDLFLLLDYGSLRSFSKKQRGTFTLPEGTRIMNIDHHAVNDFHGTWNYVDSTQPSLCSVLVDFFRSQGIVFDGPLSERLLLGVCTDSGFFTYDSNPQKAVGDALFLMQHGADYLNAVLRPVLYNQPLRLRQYFGFLLSQLVFNEEFQCGYAVIQEADIRRFGLNDAEIRLGINEIQFISECQFVFTLTVMSDHIRGSFRSKKGVDVSRFAAALGGGGHTAAASFPLPSLPVPEALERVFSTIRTVGVHRA